MIFEHGATWAAVLGAVAYGSGDFLGGCASRRLATFSAVAIAQTVAVTFMLQKLRARPGSPSGGSTGLGEHGGGDCICDRGDFDLRRLGARAHRNRCVALWAPQHCGAARRRPRAEPQDQPQRAGRHGLMRRRGCSDCRGEQGLTWRCPSLAQSGRPRVNLRRLASVSGPSVVFAISKALVQNQRQCRQRLATAAAQPRLHCGLIPPAPALHHCRPLPARASAASLPRSSA